MTQRRALDMDFCRHAGCHYLIMQASMTWVAAAPLVRASGSAGALALRSAAPLPGLFKSDRAIGEIQEATDQTFGVGFRWERPEADAFVDTIVLRGASVAALRGLDSARSYGRLYRFEQGFTLELCTSGDSRKARDGFVERGNPEWKDDR